MSTQPIHFGRLNIYVGLTGLFVAACGGMLLGLTFDKYSVSDGHHLLSLARFYLREGHSHGMPLSLYNLIVGLLLDRWLLHDGAKRVASIAAACTLFLPLGLAAKGAAGAPADFPQIGIIGALGMFVSLGVMLLAKKRPRD